MQEQFSDFLDALTQRRAIAEAVALVVAHPDDETLAAGGSMHLFSRLLLVHVTDGAPRKLLDGARAGFPSPASYALQRRRELDAALALCAAAPLCISLDIPDQEATDHVGKIAAALRVLLRRHDVRFVLTHAYEGGHPDHDAVAMATHLAGPAEVYEFAGYHAAPSGGLQTGAFLPIAIGSDAVAGREIKVDLPLADVSRKQDMVRCFETQADVLSNFASATERYRLAPNYDFGEAPHRGRLLYEEWGWMTGRSWRQRAFEAACAA